jgi:O-methyltransferase
MSLLSMFSNNIRSLLNKAGFDMVRYKSLVDRNLNIEEKLGYELEAEATEYIKIIRRNTMLSKRRLVTLYQQVVYLENNSIEGAFVECGVWKGGAVGLIALASLRHGGHTKRELHLFDSFEEICEPEDIDGERALRDVRELMGAPGVNNGRLVPLRGIYDKFGGPGTLDENKDLLENVIRYPSELIHYHKGWFQATLPVNHVHIGRIALLRLDGDWYASTKVCLDYLFDKVVKGGVVIFDDYGTYEGCKLAVDEFLKARGVSCFLHSIDADARYLIVQD